jgi:hypothetical protein
MEAEIEVQVVFNMEVSGSDETGERKIKKV